MSIQEVETPPDAKTVLRRAFVLAATSARASLESEAPEDIDELRTQLGGWVEDLHLFDAMEAQEARFLADPSAPDQQSGVNQMWRIEGLGVLAWALRLADMPPYDALVEPVNLWRALGVMDTERARELLVAPHLRDAAEVEQTRGSLLALHWRLRDFRLNETPMHFPDVAAQGGWFEQFDLGLFELAENDLALQGVTISKADEDLIDSVRRAARERHLAINWLCDASELYSDTDTST